MSSTTSNRPAQRRRPPPPRRRLPVIPIAVGVVVLLALVAVVASAVGRGDDGAPSSKADGLLQTRPVTVTGADLAPLGEGRDPAVGAPAPDVAGARFDGAPLAIDADGRPKVLVFLAHWCPHCQREVPVLADWLSEHGTPEAVDIYGIATGTDPDRPNYPPSEWLAREEFTPPTLVDDADGTAARAFGLTGFPFFVAIDADNRVVARTSGELTVAQWEALLQRPIGGAR